MVSSSPAFFAIKSEQCHKLFDFRKLTIDEKKVLALTNKNEIIFILVHQFFQNKSKLNVKPKINNLQQRQC